VGSSTSEGRVGLDGGDGGDRGSGGNISTRCGSGRSSGVGLLSPLGLLDPLLITPWASVAQSAAAGAVARSAKLLRQVLSWDLSKELLLVSAAEDVDLGAGDGVEELLDHAEDTREAPGGVDDVHLTETLGVVVLADGRDSLQVAVDGGGLGNADALEVHDCAGGLEQVARLAGTCRQTRVGHLLVLADEVLNHTLLAGDLLEGGEVDLAELLNVEGAAILQDSDQQCRVGQGRAERQRTLSVLW
jgi:hypothetical protein